MAQTYESLYKERALMDLALEKPQRVTLRDRGALVNFRQRCYQARTLDRKRSMQMYEPGSALWGRSRYDSLVFIKTGDRTITIENQGNELPLGVVSVDT